MFGLLTVSSEHDHDKWPILSFRMKHCYHLGADEVKAKNRTTIMGPCGGGKSTILRGMFDVFRLFGNDMNAVLIPRVFEMTENDGAYALMEVRDVGFVGFFDRPKTIRDNIKIVASSDLPENYSSARCDKKVKFLSQSFFSERPFAYCPQDHGLRFPGRITAPSIETKFGAVASPLLSLLQQGSKRGREKSVWKSCFKKSLVFGCFLKHGDFSSMINQSLDWTDCLEDRLMPCFLWTPP